MTSSGSESVACNKSDKVNEGYLHYSPGKGVLANKCKKNEEAEKVMGKSDES